MKALAIVIALALLGLIAFNTMPRTEERAADDYDRRYREARAKEEECRRDAEFRGPPRANWTTADIDRSVSDCRSKANYPVRP
jgi:hypothetical protein